MLTTGNGRFTHTAEVQTDSTPSVDRPCLRASPSLMLTMIHPHAWYFTNAK